MGSEEAVPCAQLAQGRAGLCPVEAGVRGEPLSVRSGMLARAVDQEGRDWGQTEIGVRDAGDMERGGAPGTQKQKGEGGNGWW